YYDCDNITDCHLDFRTLGDEEDIRSTVEFNQSDHCSINAIFGIENESTKLQEISGVLTRMDRMLFLPNVQQHHVSRFELGDKKNRGHRKIFALFLVDPTVPVISTANVQPQQRDW
ncbi:hypothetical protein EDB80DRAFT_559855, partial [Ilyonectria destructans]